MDMMDHPAIQASMHLRDHRLPLEMPTSAWLAALHVVAVTSDGQPVGMPSHLMHLPVGESHYAQRSDGRQFAVRRLAARPNAFLLENFLTEAECEALVARAEAVGFETAETSGKTSARRLCDVAFLSPSQERVLAAVQSDAARSLLSHDALQTPGGGVENLNVLRYQPGGAYHLQ